MLKAAFFAIVLAVTERRQASAHASQFSLHRGVPQRKGPYTATFSLSSSRDDLLVHVVTEPSLPDPEGCERGLAAFGSALTRSGPSVTARLKDGVAALHGQFQRENRGRAADQRVGASVLCVALRGQEVYLAQGGGMMGYLFHKDEWRVLGEESAFLGLTEPPPLRFYRHRLEEGDILLLSFSLLGRRVPLDHMTDVLGGEPQEVVERLYRLGHEEGEFAALVVWWGPATKDTVPTEVVVVPSPLSKATLSLRFFLLAVAVLLAATLVWSLAQLVPGYVVAEREARFQSLLGQARGLKAQALAASDDKVGQAKLQEASDLLQQALTLKQRDPAAVNLAGDLEKELQRIRRVVPLASPRKIVELPVGAQITQIANYGGQIYLLDRGRLYQAPSGGGTPAEASLSSGQSIGQVMLMPAGGLQKEGRLLVWDQERGLWTYDKGRGFQPLVIRGAEEWASFGAAVGYRGNLYVLDAKGRRVWRYIPTDVSYDSERQGLVAAPESALDMAVDGNVYLLTGDGQVIKFSGEVRQDFPQRGLDKPLSYPTRLFASADTKYLYVLDGGNRRVVVFTKEGEFRAQFPLSLLPAALLVDEKGGTLYFAIANALYVAPLPREALAGG
ncbi:MAG: hypothetical protein HYU86_06220 [Chloroflexi bacterium]|nr:hypothetical protein [Chloroflexota bacterium]